MSRRVFVGSTFSAVIYFKDYSLELINQNKRGNSPVIAHYYKQNGDLIPEPEMFIRVNVRCQFVEYFGIIIDLKSFFLKKKKTIRKCSTHQITLTLNDVTAMKKNFLSNMDKIEFWKQETEAFLIS